MNNFSFSTCVSGVSFPTVFHLYLGLNYQSWHTPVNDISLQGILRKHVSDPTAGTREDELFFVAFVRKTHPLQSVSSISVFDQLRLDSNAGTCDDVRFVLDGSTKLNCTWLVPGASMCWCLESDWVESFSAGTVTWKRCSYINILSTATETVSQLVGSYFWRAFD